MDCHLWGQVFVSFSLPKLNQENQKPNSLVVVRPCSADANLCHLYLLPVY